MKKITLFFLGLLINASLYSQAIPNVDWIRNFSEKPAIANIPSAIDASNNVYVTGYTFTGTLYDFTTLKYDQLGNLLWTAHYNGPASGDDFASAIALDGSGNVYVTGKSSGIGTGFDYATVKYNSAGVQQWVARYNNPLANLDDEAAMLLVDNSTGAVYVTGKSKGLTSGDDYATIKYNSSGVQQWASRYNGLGNGTDKAVSIAFGTGSKLFVTGTAKGLLNNDIVTLRYNTSSGATTWTKTYNGTSNLNDACFGMVTDGNDIFICGGTQASLTNNNYVLQKLSGNTGITQWTSFYDGYGMDDFATCVVIDGANNPIITGVAKNTSTYEYHTVKYNSAGVQQWVGKYNANISSPSVSPKLAVDPFNYYYVCGEMFSGTNRDFALLQYTTSGVHNWTETHNGAANGNDAATDMVVDNMARIYITGQTYNGSAKYDYTTIKYSQTPVYPMVDFSGETAPSSFQFYENKGQLINTSGAYIPEIKYYTNNTFPSLFIQNTSLSYVFAHIDTIPTTTDSIHRIDLQFVQSNPLTKPYSLDPQPGYLNYFQGHTPNGITNVKGFSRLMVPNIYPNIDLNYYSNQNGLKYYFVVKPGGNPNLIKMFYQGATSSSVNVGTGELTVNSSLGDIVQDRPTAYQVNFSGTVVPISGWQADYINVGTNTYRFNIGTYNPMLPLVIQVDQGNAPPASGAAIDNLTWSTYFGGSGLDIAYDVTTDNANNVYVVGTTQSNTATFPFSPGAFQTTLSGGQDAFVLKFDYGAVRQYATYYGGSSTEQGYGIAIGSTQNLYITGTSTSPSLPTLFTNNGIYIQSTGHTNFNGYVAEFDANTGWVLWETFYGGSAKVKGYKLAIDNLDNIFVTGRVQWTTSFATATGGTAPPGGASGGFPLLSTGGAYLDTAFNFGVYGTADNDAFIAKFNSSNQLEWSTIFGGNGFDDSREIAINPINQNVAITGKTLTLIAGDNVCGTPTNGGFPMCNSGAPYYQNTYNAGEGFIARFTNAGLLRWSTFFDGVPGGLVYNSNSELYVSGITTNSVSSVSTIAPTNNGHPVFNSGGAYIQTSGGLGDAYINKFNPSNQMLWGTFYGGSTDERNDSWLEEMGQTDLAVDNSNNIYMTGSSQLSTPGFNDFPTQLYPTYYLQAINQPIDNIPMSFIVAFNTTNQCQWATLYGGTGTGTSYDGYENGLAIAAADNNALYVAGYTHSNNFPYTCPPPVTGTPYCQNYTPPASFDAYLGRFDIGTLSGIMEFIETTYNLLIYPNPATNELNLEFEIQNKSKVKISVYNIVGQKVYEEQLQNCFGSYKKKIDLENYTNGMYLITVDFEDGTVAKKFIKQ